jgi:hypothetical protein
MTSSGYSWKNFPLSQGTMNGAIILTANSGFYLGKI